MHCVLKHCCTQLASLVCNNNPKELLLPAYSILLLVIPNATYICSCSALCHCHKHISRDAVPLLQVFFWLTEATADSKKSRWNCITKKLGQGPYQTQDQMQQQQEQGGIPVPTPWTVLLQQSAGARPIMPVLAHLGLQAAKLTDAEKTRSAVYADRAAGVCFWCYCSSIE